MRYGSLFSGIGGFDLGLDRAGMECAWQVEIDLYCRRVLAKHWPNVSRFEDVHHVGRHNLSAVDLVAGGFPCQPHSLAGQRRGADDDRNLWPEMRRIIAELRPRWVIAENVPGIRTTILDQVLLDLETEGYTCGTIDIPAVAFDAWHRRQRIFVVAHLDGSGGGWRADEQIGRPQERASAWRDDARDANTTGNGRRQVESQNRRGTKAEGSCSTLGEYPESFRRWAPEPDVARVVYGIPNRVDRIRGLGNAVVPQVAEWFGRQIIACDSPTLHNYHYSLYVPAFSRPPGPAASGGETGTTGELTA